MRSADECALLSSRGMRAGSALENAPPHPRWARACSGDAWETVVLEALVKAQAKADAAQRLGRAEQVCSGSGRRHGCAHGQFMPMVMPTLSASLPTLFR